MVTPLTWALYAAVHAVWAFACALDPPEVMVPVSEASTLEVTALEVGVAAGASLALGASFAAQPARARAATAPMALIRAIREIFTVDPFDRGMGGPVQGTQ